MMTTPHDRTNRRNKILPALAALVLASNVSAQTYTGNGDLGGVSRVWSDNANWSAAFPNAVGANANLGVDFTGNHIVQLNALITVGQLTLGDSSGTSTLTIDPTGSFVFDNTAATAVALTSQGGANAINVDISLLDNLNITATSALTLAGAIEGNAANRTITVSDGAAAIDVDLTGALTVTGSRTLLKAGAGTLRVSNAVNQFTNLSLGGGKLQVAHADWINTGSLTVTASTTLQLDASPSKTPSSLAINNGSTFTVTGAASGLFLFGSGDLTGGGVNSTAVLDIGYAGGVSLNRIGGDQQRNFTKNGVGQMTLRSTMGGNNGNRFFTFTLNEGGLLLGADQAMGTAASATNSARVLLNLNGGTLATSGATDRDYSNSQFNVLGGNVTFGYTTTNTGKQKLGAVAMDGGAVRTLTTATDTTFVSLTTGTGGGSLIKEGAASLILDGPGFITGSTPIEVNAGTLVVNGLAAAGLNKDTTGAQTDRRSSWIPMTDTTGIVVGMPVSGANVIANTVVSQVVAGQGIKLSTAATGGTPIASGTTLTFGGSAGGTGSLGVNVNNGGTLKGSGVIAGAVNINNAGILSPGTSIESLEMGTLNLNNGSIFDFEVDSSESDLALAADFTKVTGDLNLGGLVTLNIIDLAVVPTAFAENTVLTIAKYSGDWNGGLLTIGGVARANGTFFDIGLNKWQINYDDATGGVNFAGEYGSGGSFVNLVAVPEPGTLALLGLALAALALSRRRR